MHDGWHQVAYERNLKPGLNLATVGGCEIGIACANGQISAFHALCPHRGANLCAGGTLGDGYVTCPFHGFKIGLGVSDSPWRAAMFETLIVSGLVFVKHPDGPDYGFRARIHALDTEHFIVPGFEMAVNASASLVIENAFDVTHFKTVHNILNQPSFSSGRTDDGAFFASGRFHLPPSQWQTQAARAGHADVPFTATAFSPTIVLTDLGGANPYSVLTASQSVSETQSIVRLSLLIPSTNKKPPCEEDCRYLLQQAKAGIEQDVPIWERMAWPPIFNPVPSDASVLGFQEFCGTFAAAPIRASRE